MAVSYKCISSLVLCQGRAVLSAGCSHSGPAAGVGRCGGGCPPATKVRLTGSSAPAGSLSRLQIDSSAACLFSGQEAWAMDNTFPRGWKDCSPMKPNPLAFRTASISCEFGLRGPVPCPPLRCGQSVPLAELSERHME